MSRKFLIIAVFAGLFVAALGGVASATPINDCHPIMQLISELTGMSFC